MSIGRVTLLLLGLGGLLAAVTIAAGAVTPDLVAGYLVGASAAAVILWPRAAPPSPPASRDAEAASRAFATLMEAIDDPMLLIERGRVARANAAARRVLGEHVVGEDLRLAIRHPRAPEVIAGASEDAPGRLSLSAVGGESRQFELQATAIDGGRRLVRLADRAEARVAEKMRTDFVANASHELRTPLATLIGFVETLEDANAAEDAPTRARFLKIMMNEARRMQHLVDDLISLSRIEADRFSAPATSVLLGPLAEEVRGTVSTAQRLEPERIAVVADPDAAVPGDRAQLGQLLHNLVGNALKYGRPGSPVAVTIERSDARVVIRVADKGEGIAPQHLPRLTERFYRVDPGRSRALGGTGLGLAIVKHIVERHRGRLTIESRQGVGTVVTVSLPTA